MPKLRFRIASIAIFPCAALPVWHAVFASLPSGHLSFHSLDIGQGDATFIETPRHHQILIDGGPDQSVLSELGAVMAFSDKTIDLIVLTHPQEDHMFGLIPVLERYHVGAVLMTGVNYQTSTYAEFKKVIAEKNIPLYRAHAGQNIRFNDGVALDILYPFDNLEGKDFAGDVNDTSVASRITFGGKKFLVMGDAGMLEETNLVNSEEDLDIDVLKVSHHGSRTSTSRLFLENTTPSIAVISVGARNRYGHPTKETLDRLDGISVYRTDKNGRVEITTDGIELKTVSER